MSRGHSLQAGQEQQVIIDTRTEAGPALDDRDDFTNLKLVAAQDASLFDVAHLLDARVDEDETTEHVWVAAAVLRRLAGDVPAEWHENFDAMLAKVEPFGWYDSAAGAVKCHVERTAD